MRVSGFFSELGRRRVWRVAGAYVLVIWMALEIILETAPVLGFPDWIARLAVMLAIAGFPVTLVLAWAFDITPQGVVRTPSLDAPPSEAAAGGGRRPEDEPPPSRVVLQTGPARLAGVFGAGMLVALVGMGAYAIFVPMAVVRPEAIQAIAVLPFTDRSAAGDEAYFADGMTDELINRLARIEEIRVAGRTSSFMFRGAAGGLDEVARQLDVDAVVEGSVQRDGDRLRVSVELVDAGSGFQIWSDSYDRTVDDVFAIQDEIAGAIVEALRLQLVPGASRIRAGTGSIRAHDAYLLGLARWHGRTEADLLRALAYFEEAIAQDGSFAPAYAGLALTYALLPAYTDISAAEAAERGSTAAARALALNAQLAEAHAAIGQIARGLEWNLAAAEMAFRRAIDFQPSYGMGHQWYAEVLLITGRLEEARVELDRALALDPLSFSGRQLRAYLLTVARDPAAREAYRELVRQHPDHRTALEALVSFCLAADCHEDALAAAEALAAPAAGAAPGVGALLRLVVRADAEPALRDQALTALEHADGAFAPARRALLHAALHDRAGAVALLERAYAEGVDPELPLLLVHPLFDPVRRDPRFRAVADAIGAEAPAAVVARPL